MEDAAFFFRLAQRMGLQLSWTQTPGYRAHLEGPTQTLPFDMRREPSNEDLIALTCANSRLPLDEVKRHPHGRVFDEAKVRVAPRDPACTAMLQLADPLMMAELAQVRAEAPRQAALDGQRTQLLVSRRLNRVMNSVGQPFATAVEGDGDGATPGFMPSADLAALALALAPGDLASVASAHGEMRVRLIADDDWRTGVISVSQGFGLVPGADSVTRRVSMDELDAITGLPRLSAVSVSITRAKGAGNSCRHAHPVSRVRRA